MKTRYDLITKISFFTFCCSLLVNCSNNDDFINSNFNDEDQAKLAECHAILDEYKDYWTYAPGYTSHQRDSMLIDLGPENLRSLIELFTTDIWNQELNEVCNNNTSRRTDNFSIYGTHKSMLATSRSTITLEIGSGNLHVVDTKLETNPACKWKPDPYTLDFEFNEKGHAIVGATGIARAIGHDFFVQMSGYVDKVAGTIGYEGKVEHCKVYEHRPPTKSK